METPSDSLDQMPKTKRRKILVRIATAVGVFAVVIVNLGLRARRACDLIAEGEFSPLRRSTRFVLRPHRLMDGVENGIQPGWVVTYADSRYSGTAFFVSVLGKVRARGTPAFVLDHRKDAESELARFRRDFSERDAATGLGKSFSTVAASLGAPIDSETNRDGIRRMFYSYEPPIGPVPIDWMTNGFTLFVSNNVIVGKDYSFVSVK